MKFQEYIPYYRRNLKLALPVVMSQIGQVTVSLVDNMMVGHVGTPELAAASFANSVFMIGMVFGMGLTMGFTPVVGSAVGKNDRQEILAWLKNGVFSQNVAAFALTLLMFSLYFLLPYMGQPSEVLMLAKPYYLVLCASYLPFMWFFTLKQFFEGLGNTKMAMQITLISNVINIVVNYLFIFGQLGLPEMGLMGAGLGTLVSRIVMPIMFVWFILRKSEYRDFFAQAHQQSLKRDSIITLLKIGIPIGFQLIVEVSAFAVGSVMMGWLGEIPLAAHQVALGLATFTYMISLGVSQANTIRVSHQMGERNYDAMKYAVYASTHLVLAFMLCGALVFVLGRNVLPLLFTSDQEVVTMAASLLFVAAIFQLFDGLQVVMLSTLRGMADVKTPMYIAFFSYLLIGLPVSYIFAFPLGVGAPGIWYGFLVGLGSAGILFFLRFRKNLRRLGAL